VQQFSMQIVMTRHTDTYFSMPLSIKLISELILVYYKLKHSWVSLAFCHVFVSAGLRQRGALS